MTLIHFDPIFPIFGNIYAEGIRFILENDLLQDKLKTLMIITSSLIMEPACAFSWGSHAYRIKFRVYNCAQPLFVAKSYNLEINSWFWQPKDNKRGFMAYNNMQPFEHIFWLQNNFTTYKI